MAHLTDNVENLKNAVSTHWEADEKRYQTEQIGRPICLSRPLLFPEKMRSGGTELGTLKD